MRNKRHEMQRIWWDNGKMYEMDAEGKQQIYIPDLFVSSSNVGRYMLYFCNRRIQVESVVFHIIALEKELPA